MAMEESLYFSPTKNKSDTHMACQRTQTGGCKGNSTDITVLKVFLQESIHNKHVGYIKQYMVYAKDIGNSQIYHRGFSGPYSIQMWENTDQKNYEYGHFSRNVSDHYSSYSNPSM